MGRKSLVEEEGVLTRRHNILKEREIVRIMKSLRAEEAARGSIDSVLSPKSKRSKKSARKSSGQQEAETINLARAWRSKATDKKKEDSTNEKRKVMKEKSKSIDDTLDTSPPQLDRQHSYSCSELNSGEIQTFIFHLTFFHFKIFPKVLQSFWIQSRKRMMEILRRIKVHSDVEYLQGPTPAS